MMLDKNTKVKIRLPDGHRLLWHCRRCFARRYSSPIPVHNLPSQRASNVDRFNERKWLYTEKGKKQTIHRTNYNGRGLRWLHSTTAKYTPPSQIPTMYSGEGNKQHRPSCQCRQTEYLCFNQNLTRDISTRTDNSMRPVDKFTYLESSVSSTENDINTRLVKTWSAIDKLSVIWKSDIR